MVPILTHKWDVQMPAFDKKEKLSDYLDAFNLQAD